MSRAVICPTITAVDSREYNAQMNRISSFAKRIHIDVADGQLAPRKLIDLDQLWWPGNITVDIHIMYQQPFTYTELLIVQHPELVIVHAEADGDFLGFSARMHKHGIEVGVALLPQTKVDTIMSALGDIDHVLIFSGNLGFQGGSQADFSLLKKVRALKALKPALEIGWDGGVDDQNARTLIDGGVEVLNVGGYIQQAANAAEAYAKLEAQT